MSTLPSYALAPLPAALALLAWQESAACRFEDRDLFFPPEEERGRYAAFREAAAKQICRGCPVLGECLDYARRRRAPRSLGRTERGGAGAGAAQKASAGA